MHRSPVAPPTEKEPTCFNSQERDTPKVQETSYLPSYSLRKATLKRRTTSLQGKIEHDCTSSYKDDTINQRN